MRISNRAGRLSVTGFTLLEMMIAVAVAGILAAIAIPIYSDYITRSKIVGATSRMGDIRTQMEKFFSDNRTYLNGGACGAAAAIAAYNADPASNFNMTCPGPTATTYTIQVDGIGARGMGGFTYTVDQANAKQTVAVPGGWAGGGLNCWVLKKDGSC